MDIAPEGLIPSLHARPFQTTFMRQVNAARSLYRKQLVIPKWNAAAIQELAQPLLEYYPVRDRGIILDRVTACILRNQKAFVNPGE